MKRIAVNTGNESYTIYIGSESLDQLPHLIRQTGLFQSVAIISDENVDAIYGELIRGLLDNSGIYHVSLTFPAGESSKTLKQADYLLSRLIEIGLKRDDLILAVGGGVTGDLAGFAASIYMRGTACAQLPTTLLSQIDSSIGGKTGVNHPKAKNMVGTFYQPCFVHIDPEVLRTLEKRERIAGMGEMIKYGLIGDESFFSFLESNLESLLNLSDMPLMEAAIARCCRIKADVVARDEKETGLRRILNFGHTLGHALEAEGRYAYFRHGEAVIWGMRWASWISFRNKLISGRTFERIEHLLTRVPVPDLPDFQASALLNRIKSDKKQTLEGLKWIMLEKIGHAKIETAERIEELTEEWLNEQKT